MKIYELARMCLVGMIPVIAHGALVVETSPLNEDVFDPEILPVRPYDTDHNLRGTVDKQGHHHHDWHHDHHHGWHHDHHHGGHGRNLDEVDMEQEQQQDQEQDKDWSGQGYQGVFGWVDHVVDHVIGEAPNHPGHPWNQ